MLFWESKLIHKLRGKSKFQSVDCLKLNHIYLEPAYMTASLAVKS